MTAFDRGDVVLVDLGMAAKTRPCVVISIRQPDRQRNLAVVVPLTTEIRGGEYEVCFPKPRWLRQESVVNVLGIAGVDSARIHPKPLHLRRRSSIAVRHSPIRHSLSLSLPAEVLARKSWASI